MTQQQDMNYGEMGHEQPGPTYGGYQGMPFANVQGEKLTRQTVNPAPTAGQRLALAITSLSMLMLMTFGLIGIAAMTQAPTWSILPILFILFLFSAAVVIINVVFNQKS